MKRALAIMKVCGEPLTEPSLPLAEEAGHRVREILVRLAEAGLRKDDLKG